MTILIDGFVNATIILAGIYFFLSLLAAQKLNWLHKKSSELNTRKLFVMSCFLTCILRCMSFTSISILNFGNYDIDTSAADGDIYTSSSMAIFFDKAFIVLFDFPDFPCISAYMLLSMVWAEAYFQSRRHWLSSLYFRQVWMIAYLVFNILLYSTQFSGFPFSSLDAQLRLASLGRLATIWTAARFCWGIIDLTSVVEGWMDQAQKSKVSYSIILIAIFILTEVMPMVTGLLSRSLQSLTEEQQEGEEVSVWDTQRPVTAPNTPTINILKKKIGESDDDLDYTSAHEGNLLHGHNNSTRSSLASTYGQLYSNGSSSSQDMRRHYGNNSMTASRESTGNFIDNDSDGESLLRRPVHKKHWLVRLFGMSD